jgi:hypothetical protein
MARRTEINNTSVFPSRVLVRPDGAGGLIRIYLEGFHHLLTFNLQTIPV